MADDEKFLVVPLGKKSKAITQTVSNDTAMEIMELLADGPMSTTAVAEKLSIPLTTAQYNIEKLMEADLVRIARTKYSEKGREVKLYEAMNRAIIILPGKSGAGAVMEALKRYIILLPVVAVISLIVEYLVPLTQAPNNTFETFKSGVSVGSGSSDTYLMNALPSPTASTAPMLAPAIAPGPVPTEAARSVLDQTSQSIMPIVQHSGLLFFAGCVLVMMLLIVLEAYQYRKTPKK